MSLVVFRGLNEISLFSILLMSVFWSCGEQENSISTNKSLCSQPESGCFSPSWQAQSDNYHLELLSSDPERPERGVNTWIIAVKANDESKEALTNCELTVVPFMPEHGHGSPMMPTVSELSAGQYEVNDIVFNMPGLWELEFQVNCLLEAMQAESMVYTFWLDG